MTGTGPAGVVRRCPQCAAVVQMPPGALSDRCSYCATPLVDEQAGAAAIERVVPFRLDAQGAAEALRQRLRRAWLAPAALRKAMRPDRVDGVLVPFWSIRAAVRTRYRARAGFWWWETITTTEIVDGKPVTRTRRVRRTEWFPLEGTHAAELEGHLVSASRGLPEHESNALEPFDLDKGVDWAPEAVAGWRAELPGVPEEVAREVACREIEALEARAIRGFVPADEVSVEHLSCDVRFRGMERVLLPVWIAVYGRGEGAVRLLVNGQTGKVAGRLPIAWGRVFAIGLVVLVVLVGLALWLEAA